MIWLCPSTLVRVVDADTLALDNDRGEGMWRRGKTYRLARINAPEKNTAAGQAAIAALTTHLQGKQLISQTFKTVTFDRYVVEVMADGANVNDWLVSQGLATYQDYA